MCASESVPRVNCKGVCDMKRISMGLRESDPAIVKALQEGTEAQEQIAHMVAAVLVDVRAQRGPAPVPTAPVTQWRFDVVRDEDGQMQSIIATAVST